MSIRDLLDVCVPTVRIPKLGDNIYKDECCLSFETQESEDGLYICLCTFLGFSKRHLDLYYSISKNRLFLNIKKVKQELPVASDNEVVEQKPKRLAIGIEGGFNPDKNGEVEYKQIETLYLMPEKKVISFDDLEEINSVILASVSGILSSTSAANKQEILAWDGEERPVSKYADALKQLDNGVSVPPSDWKCCMCDLTNNLWLNLTDGSILCGRRYFDGTGGNNHAVEHFNKTKYPLAVKLGTITPSGADVYSYDEDTMVEDPNLAVHLAHFGINMMNMEKTEQTMTELEIKLNQKLGNEWDLIQEAGENLKELHGPGLTGIRNMGNTCYMNSVIQVLLSIPSIQKVYADPDCCMEIFKSKLMAFSPESGLHQMLGSYEISSEIAKRVDSVMSDFKFQMCKLGYTLYYSDAISSDEKKHDIALPWPRYLKQIIGKKHADFCTNRQQDAHEYLLHLLNVMERNQHKTQENAPGECFKFFVEERLECLQSKDVKCSNRPEYVCSLPVPLDMATNKEKLKEYEERKEKKKRDVNFEVGEVIRAEIPFAACLERFAADEIVDDFYSAEVKKKGQAKKRTLFATFPEYLIVQLKKFAVGDDWIPKKLDVSVDMPDRIDLGDYLGNAQATEIEIRVDSYQVRELTSFGFPHDKCVEAVRATENGGVEAAIIYLTSKYPDGFATKPEEPKEVNQSHLAELQSMGFTSGQATKALLATDNNLERACDYIFSHMDEPEEDISAPASVPEPQEPQSQNVTTKFESQDKISSSYELMAFISHMGTSTMSGHYVCHMKKDGRWVIFNDEKVAESRNPPRNLGYIYFYRRLPGPAEES